MPRRIVEAVRSNDMDTLRECIEAGVNVNEKETKVDHRCALHWASVLANIDALEWLIGNNANIEALDRQGHTPLHLACIHGHPHVVRYLLDHGSNRFARNNFNKPPLGLVCLLGGGPIEKKQIQMILLRDYRPPPLQQQEEVIMMLQEEDGPILDATTRKVIGGRLGDYANEASG